MKYTPRHELIEVMEDGSIFLNVSGRRFAATELTDIIVEMNQIRVQQLKDMKWNNISTA